MDVPAPYLMAFGLGTTLVLLALLRAFQRLVLPGQARPQAPGRTVAEKLGAGTTARSLLQVGQVLGVFLLAAHVVKSCVRGESVAHDLTSVAAFGVAGLALTMITAQLGIALLLKEGLGAEIERGNRAAGLAAGAHYVATALITADALAGSNARELGLSLAFFGIAQLTLLVFISLFRALTTYDDAEQIHGENFAAALSYAGMSIAVAVVVARALDGDFVSWGVSLRGYGEVLLLLLALYPVRQLLVQSLLLGAPFTLRGGRLDTGIAAERDAGMGALEAASYVATSLAVAHLV